MDIVTNRLIVSLLWQLGKRWSRGEGGIAKEHCFSMFLRNKLGALSFTWAKVGRVRSCLACLPGERYEVGLLLFASAALGWNYRVVLLDPNTPLEELSPVAVRAVTQAIVLSGSVNTAAR